jgi:hypothetical protein
MTRVLVVGAGAVGGHLDGRWPRPAATFASLSAGLAPCRWRTTATASTSSNAVAS